MRWAQIESDWGKYLRGYNWKQTSVTFYFLWLGTESWMYMILPLSFIAQSSCDQKALLKGFKWKQQLEGGWGGFSRESVLGLARTWGCGFKPGSSVLSEWGFCWCVYFMANLSFICSHCLRDICCKNTVSPDCREHKWHVCVGDQTSWIPPKTKATLRFLSEENWPTDGDACRQHRNPASSQHQHCRNNPGKHTKTFAQ